MKRSQPLRSDPAKTLAWLRESRAKPWQARKPLRSYSQRKRERDPIREAVFERDGWQCAMANGLFYCDGPLTYHHRRKASSGGAYSIANGMTLCLHHNGQVEDEPWAFGDLAKNGRQVVVREGDAEWDELGRRAAREAS